MGQEKADGMNARAVLGAAYATGCAPEGAIPTALGAPGIATTPQRRNAHLEAVFRAITQRFSQARHFKKRDGFD